MYWCQDEYWPFWSACQSGYLPLCCNALEYFYIDDQYYDCTCSGTHGIFTYECYCELLEYDTALWCVNYEPEVSLPRDVAIVAYDRSSVCVDYEDPTERGLCRFTLMDTNEDYLITMEDWSYYFSAFTHGYINEDNLFYLMEYYYVADVLAPEWGLQEHMGYYGGKEVIGVCC